MNPPPDKRDEGVRAAWSELLEKVAIQAVQPPKQGYERRAIYLCVEDECDAGGEYVEVFDVSMEELNLLRGLLAPSAPSHALHNAGPTPNAATSEVRGEGHAPSSDENAEAAGEWPSRKGEAGSIPAPAATSIPSTTPQMADKVKRLLEILECDDLDDAIMEAEFDVKESLAAAAIIKKAVVLAENEWPSAHDRRLYLALEAHLLTKLASAPSATPRIEEFKTARYGWFKPDGSFEELDHFHASHRDRRYDDARWVGGKNDMQLLNAVFRRPDGGKQTDG